MSAPEQLLTTQQFAKQAGISASTVAAWLRKGKLKGRKQQGKWMISKDQLAIVGKAAMPDGKDAGSRSDGQTKKTKPAANISSGKSFGVDEFCAMTYLTRTGVEKWAIQGRVGAIRDDSGHWRISASNLDNPLIQRLLR